MIVVGGKDAIIDSESLKKYTEKNWKKCTFQYFENEGHGFIFQDNYCSKIKTMIDSFCKNE